MSRVRVLWVLLSCSSCASLFPLFRPLFPGIGTLVYLVDPRTVLKLINFNHSGYFDFVAGETNGPEESRLTRRK